MIIGNPRIEYQIATNFEFKKKYQLLSESISTVLSLGPIGI